MKIFHKVLRTLLTGVLLGAAWYHPAAAQEGNSLSLAEALSLGLENNFDIRIERKRVDIAENNNSWGEAGRWPTINLVVDQQNSLSDVPNAAPFQLSGTTIRNSVSPGVNVSWTLFNGFAVNISKHRLALLEEQSMGNAALVVENTMKAIIGQYYQAVLEKERLEVFRRTLDVSGDRYRYVQERKRIGSAVTFDLLQEQTAYLTDSSNYVRQVQAYGQALRDLKVLLALPLDHQIQVSDSLEVIETNFDYDALYAQMAANNTNLRNQYLNQQLLKKSVMLAQAQQYPTITATGGYSHNRSRLDLSQANVGEGTPPVINNLSNQFFVNFTLNFTLYDGGRVKRDIANAMVEENIGDLLVDELMLELSNDLKTAVELYDVRKSLQAISALNAEASQLNVQLAEDKYSTGIINSFDYRDIQLAFLNASLENLQARYDLIQSETEILRLTGSLLQE
ncbi:TolC family protein [Roseivirga sp. BDSF3-8]|uniref:TolC family protein n=1 Tax=Roseivirga sp. BDSF3-8 TaxID=3241598 RepID=UPI0035324F73